MRTMLQIVKCSRNNVHHNNQKVLFLRFARATTLSINTTKRWKSNKQRKRKSINDKSKLKKLLTTKENLYYKNDVTANSSLISGNYSSELMSERFVTRVELMRQSLLGIWRSDHGPAPSLVRPKMDARWWFYNLLFASLPAIFIVIGCEFFIRPRMIAHYEENNDIEKPDHWKPMSANFGHQQETTKYNISSLIKDTIISFLPDFYQPQQKQEQQQEEKQSLPAAPLDNNSIQTHPSVINNQEPKQEEKMTKELQELSEIKLRIQQLEEKLILSQANDTPKQQEKKSNIRKRIEDRKQAQKEQLEETKMASQNSPTETSSGMTIASQLYQSLSASFPIFLENNNPIEKVANKPLPSTSPQHQENTVKLKESEKEIKSLPQTQKPETSNISSTVNTDLNQQIESTIPSTHKSNDSKETADSVHSQTSLSWLKQLKFW